MIYRSECGVYKIEKLWDVIRFYKNDELHADGDNPAVKRTDGTKQYWKNGKCHRDGNLPAIYRLDGTKEWWKDGKYHRDGDLPAIERADGTKQYWKNGIPYNPNEITLKKGDKIEIVYEGETKTFKKGQFINLTFSI